MPLGFVSLVGAGPGPAEFLTLAAAQAIAEADVILYDALIGADVRASFPTSSQKIYVGKRCGKHALQQEQINELLVEHASRGAKVVRLKGGDPLIFGRAAEELAALRRAGLPYRIIPGISAFNGLAAPHALPLTDRCGSHEFRVIQGHHLDPHPRYWHELARYEGTLVIYMGLEQLALILERLLNLGAPPEQLVAIIESASTGLEYGHPESTRVTRSTLRQLLRAGFVRQLDGPGLVYIGPNLQQMNLEAYSHKNEETFDASQPTARRTLSYLS